jgi:hypothetical protein
MNQALTALASAALTAYIMLPPDDNWRFGAFVLAVLAVIAAMIAADNKY